MNWGKGLTVAMILFMGFIIYLTVIKLQKTLDLEVENYYEREINYEQEIQAQRNANMFEKIMIKNDDEFIVLSIPETIDMANVKVLFIRPNDKNLDKTFHFEDTKILLIRKDELKIGKYKLEITYRIGDKECLQKEEIVI
jgi:nitrogen fixation protein FixH